jgi:hypothetical protein
VPECEQGPLADIFSQEARRGRVEADRRQRAAHLIRDLPTPRRRAHERSRVLSTALELLGFAALTAGTYLLAGPGWALLVAGVALLYTGWAVDKLNGGTSKKKRTIRIPSGSAGAGAQE